MKTWAYLPRGLVLVTGPTGSGKSTTLASLIDIVNRERSVHIMTVEDPIEFLHTHKRSLINQREVGEDTHSFAAALKHVLRQDPDVILVGEMRDLETISTALTAAETGHLVFATLHTQDAPQSIDRVIDVFPAHQQQQVRVQLASALQGICTQQLIPTVDGQGRAIACEVMVATPAVRNLIREGKTHQIYSMLQAGGRYGMVTMDMSLVQLVRSGPDHAGHGARTVRQRRRPPPPDERLITMPETFPYKVRDKAGKLVEGQLEAENAQLVVSKLRSMGYVPIEIEQQGGTSLERGPQDPGPLRPGQAEGRRGLLAPVRDDDQLRPVDAALALHPRRADREQAARRDRQPGADRRRAGLVAVGRAGQAPEGVQPPLRRDGARR